MSAKRGGGSRQPRRGARPSARSGAAQRHASAQPADAELLVEDPTDELLTHTAGSVGEQASALSRADGASRERAVHRVQLAHGNVHAQRLVSALRVQREVGTLTATGTPGTSQGPADVNVGFNPMDITHKLLIAIDQSDVNVFSDMKRKVDFNTCVSVLTNLSAAEGKAVRDEYAKHEGGRTLDTDLFGKGESGFESNLKEDQRSRLKYLLAGTRVVNKDDQDALTNKRKVIATEMHALLEDDLEDADVQKVMAMIRGGAEQNAALGQIYEQLYGKPMSAALCALGAGRMPQVLALLMGRNSDADSMVVGGKRLRIEEIDKEIAELQDETGMEALIARAKIEDLRDERKKLAGQMQQRTQDSMNEARTEATNKGGDADAAAKQRAGAVLGDIEATASVIAGKDGRSENLADAALLKGIAKDDPVAKAAATLRRAAATDDLTPETISATLRTLREQADAHAKLENPKATAEELKTKTAALADSYFEQLRSSYDAMAGEDMHFDKLLEETGGDDDALANSALMKGRGKLSDVDELVMALTGDRKDTETVERILKDKSAVEIKILKSQYMMRTLGRSLDYDLFGEAPTTEGEDNPEWMGKHLKEQGKAEGTSRLNLEDFMQRPTEEGGLEEANYISARAEREYDYTIENRGMTGAWRDAWGNEQRDLLDETIKEVRGLHWQYLMMSTTQPNWSKGEEAHKVLQRMRQARATIRGDRAAYEKATAELRATFEAIASFVLQAALMAVLGPLAEIALLGELAQGASTALKIAKFAQTAAVGTAATIGANMAVYGKDYSLSMLKADLLGGMGGAIGPALVGPYAKNLVNKLGSKVSGEIAEFAKKEVVGVITTIAGMETGALAQGEHMDFSASGIAQAHMMGKGGEVITNKVGQTLGTMPKSPAGGGAHGDSTTTTTTEPTTTTGDAPPTSATPEITPASTSEPTAAGGESAAGASATGLPNVVEALTTASKGGDAAAGGAPAAGGAGATATQAGEAGASAKPATAAEGTAASGGAASAGASAAHAGEAGAAAKPGTATETAAGGAPYAAGGEAAANAATTSGGAAAGKGAHATGEVAPADAATAKPATDSEAHAAELNPPPRGPNDPAALGAGGMPPERVSERFVEHPEMANVRIDRSIPSVDMPELLRLLESTPQGERIADRIRAGEVNVSITNEGIGPRQATGMAIGDDIHIQWMNSLAETVSTFVHEGTHNLDPHNPGGVPDSRISREAIARAFQYEQRELAGLPPYDAVEQAYRDARDDTLAHGGTQEQANAAGDLAIVAAMRVDAGWYEVESLAQERAMMNELPPIPQRPGEFTEPQTPLEAELFGDFFAEQEFAADAPTNPGIVVPPPEPEWSTPPRKPGEGGGTTSGTESPSSAQQPSSASTGGGSTAVAEPPSERPKIKLKNITLEEAKSMIKQMIEAGKSADEIRATIKALDEVSTETPGPGPNSEGTTRRLNTPNKKPIK